MMSAFIKMDNIEKYYESSGNVTKAIDRISFEIKEGEFIGIMGESGSGKNFLAQYTWNGRYSYGWTHLF